MGRGDRRLKVNRKKRSTTKRVEHAVNAPTASELTIRRLVLSTLACTGAAVSALGPAHALNVGELTVQSPLGQPLSATVPVELAAGELLVAGCVTAERPAARDLSAVPDPVVSFPESVVPGRYELRVSTSRALYEPMYELRLQLRCPGSARMVRQYVLMLDLPGAVPQATLPVLPVREPVAAAQGSTEAATPAPQMGPASPTSAEGTPAPRRAVKMGTPLESGTVYRVQAGDTLSTIAARITARGGRTIWEVADEIFTRNPAAFIDANPDLIRTGIEILLPAPATAAPEAREQASAAPAPNVVDTVEAPAAQTSPTDSAAETAPAPATLETRSQTESWPVTAEEPPPIIAEVPTPVFLDEQLPRDEAAAKPLEVAVATAEGDSAGGDGASAWLAALVGVLLGAVASFLLLRERLIDALRSSVSRREVGHPVAVPAPQNEGETPAKPPKFGRPQEPSMVVVEERRDDHEQAAAAKPMTRPHPAQVPAEPRGDTQADPTSELATLFNEEPDLALFEADSAQGAEARLDLDLSAASTEAELDQEIGWLNDLEETALTPTDRSGALYGSDGETVEHLDLNTLSQRAIDDPNISDTLKEALDLLEDDYESELTSSQMIDRAKLGDVLDVSDDEDTLVRTGTDQFPRR